MGLSIINRPTGFCLGGYIYPAFTISSSGGDALFDVGTHGLSTGTFIYIYSSINSYNGFWAITVISGTSFKLQNPSGGFVQFTQNGINQPFRYAVNYYLHKWSCVHLPIIYRFKSTLWPTNTVDTSRTVSSFANDSNYVKLTLSGSLGTFNALAYVKISGANSSAVNGSFQILTKISSSVITINLPYNAAYDFTNGNVILYYNNYHLSVNVWSGLDSGHPWTALKPLTKILNISIVPGSDNIAMLNINEYLKPSLEIIANSLTLDTLPNNIDFMTQFYIEYEETYDTSDGTNVTTFQSGFVSDSSFKGYAVNAKLPFKNRFSGFMSQYIYGFTVPQKFLTNFTNPSLVPSKYFDVSFIIDENIETATTSLAQQLYDSKDNLISTVYTAVGSGTSNYGIYRFPIKQQSSESYQQIFLFNNSNMIIAPNLWTNGGGPYTAFDAVSSTAFSDDICSPGVNYGAFMAASIPLNGTPSPITLSFDVFGLTSFNFFVVRISFYTSIGGTLVGQAFHTFNSNGTGQTVTFSFSPLSGASTVMSISSVYQGSPSGGLTINIYPPIGQPFYYGTNLLSEIKKISIDTKCYDQNYYLTWLNPLGGFDYWNFTGRSDHNKQIEEVVTQEKNIFPKWPSSWNEFADTITSESKRRVKTTYLLRSQNLTKDQLDAVSAIKESPLVQLIYDGTISKGFGGAANVPDDSFHQTRTLLLDKNSFHIRKDGDKIFNISFTATYTDFVSNQEL